MTPQKQDTSHAKLCLALWGLQNDLGWHPGLQNHGELAPLPAGQPARRPASQPGPAGGRTRKRYTLSLQGFVE